MKILKDFTKLKKYIKNPIPLANQLLNDSPYPITVIDKEFKVKYVNKNVLKLYRMDIDDLLYKNYLGKFSIDKAHYIEMSVFFENIKKNGIPNRIPSAFSRTELFVFPISSSITNDLEYYFIINIVSTSDLSETQKKMKILNDDYANFTHHLSTLIEAKDKYTALHSANVEKYSVMLGKEIGMDDYDLEMLRVAASIHDIGKIKIPNTILNKPGKLSDEEYKIIKNHAKYTSEILGTLEFFNSISSSAGHHHERYDGLGYHDNIKGEEIPLMSRIMAIADTYDAMTTDRPYRKALPVNTALNELIKHKWTQFDPYLVDKFVNLDFSGTNSNIKRLENELLNVHQIPSEVTDMMNAEITEFLQTSDVFQLIEYIFGSDIYGLIALRDNASETSERYEIIYQNHFIDKLERIGALSSGWEPCFKQRPMDKCVHCFIDACQLRGEVVNRNVRLVANDGTNIYLDVSAIPYHDMSTDTRYTIEIIRDATAETEMDRHTVTDFFNFLENLYSQFSENNAEMAQISVRLKPLATWIAKKIGLDEYEIELLHKALLICDLGIIALADSNEFRYKSLTELRLSKIHIDTICELIEGFNSFRDVKNIVLYHHNFYNETKELGKLNGADVPIHSYIIATADHILTKLVEGNSLDKILSKLEDRSGLELSPRVAKYILNDDSKIELEEYIKELDKLYG